MSDRLADAEFETTMGTDADTGDLVQEYPLEAPPEKVWRALTIPALRQRWLPDQDLAEVKPLAEMPGEEISFRMRDDAPPYLESVVAFQLRPGSNGGTILRIVHRLADDRLASQKARAANSNEPILMLAA
ncbi:polyketide cyclase [Rhodobacterales bacterium]|nr:polyketide cyclase [Rhodobacterales bacterium]